LQRAGELICSANNADILTSNSRLDFKEHSLPALRVSMLVVALLLATPAFAARCDGDFNTFVQSISAEAPINTGRGVLSHTLRCHGPAAISARVGAPLQVLWPGSTPQAKELPHDQEQATYDGHVPDLGNARILDLTS
jgi:hypothetical protein